MKKTLLLPQNDIASLASRQRYLAKMQKTYAFTLSYNDTIATINKLPSREEPGCYYKFKGAMQMLTALPSLPSLLSKYVKFSLLKRPYKKFDDLFFFNRSPFPNEEMRENFKDNKFLGYQRVAGMNPVVIEGVTEDNPLPKEFHISANMLNMTETDFIAGLAEGEYFQTNYSMLKPLVENPGMVDELTKYVAPAIALYKLNASGNLDIQAVQLDVTQITSDTNPIITPEDDRWTMARAIIQAADGTHQELWTHATRIHYLMESIIMVSWRQLGGNHPLLALLKPHLTYTLSVNVNPLFEKQPDGTTPAFGEMFACDNDSLVEFMAEGMRKYSFKEYQLPNDIKNRHIDNPKLDYPYRDDGLLWWNEIQRFTLEYLKLYYTSNEDVIEDNELQAWAKELGGDRKTNNCGLTDFPTAFISVEQLAEIVGLIIYTSTAHHSAVHYPQYECAGFPPNLAFSDYLPTMTSPENYQTEKQQVKMLPRFRMAWQQAFIFFLTNFRVNKAGQYPITDFDLKSQKVLEVHQLKIEKIGETISLRNQSRTFPYHYMHPNRVPNSVTV